MKNTKRVLCLVVCGLLLAAVSVSAQIQQSQDKPFHRTHRSTVPTTPRFKPAVIWTDPHYKTTLVQSGLDWPTGIGVDHSGGAVLINTYNDYSLWRYRSGTLKWLDDFYAWPVAGRMYGAYYTGDNYGNLFKFNVSTQKLDYVTGWDDYYLEIGAIDIDKVNGTVYFMLNDWYDYPSEISTYLYSYDPDTDTTTYIYGWYGFVSWGLAVKGDSVYIADGWGGVVYQMPKQGGSLSLFASGMYDTADIEFDRDGNLYILEFDGGCVDVLRKGYTEIKRIATGFESPNYIGVDDRGDVFFTDAYAGKLYKLKKK